MKLPDKTRRVLTIIFNILVSIELFLGISSTLLSGVWGNTVSAWISFAVGVAPPLILILGQFYPRRRSGYLDVILRTFAVFAYALFIVSFFYSKPLTIFWLSVCVSFFVASLAELLIEVVKDFRVAPARTKAVYLLVPFVAILGIGIPLLSYELQCQRNIDSVKHAMDEMAQAKIMPLGAVERGKPVYRRDGVISFTDDYCSYMHPCPTGSRTWYVLLDVSKHKRGEVITSMFKSMGYTVGEYYDGGLDTGGSKGGVSLGVNLQQLGNEKPPYAAPKDKVWRLLNLRGELVHSYYGGPPIEAKNLKTFSSQFEDLTFDYDASWWVDERTVAGATTITINSPDGKAGLEPSGEPKAMSGKVIKLVISPCAGGRQCTLDGVYDGVYQHSAWPHGDPIALDDGTQAAAFFFQYQGEDATRYTIFFRDGKKYVATLNVAGANAIVLSNDSSDSIYYDLTQSMRFYK